MIKVFALIGAVGLSVAIGLVLLLSALGVRVDFVGGELIGGVVMCGSIVFVGRWAIDRGWAD